MTAVSRDTARPRAPVLLPLPEVCRRTSLGRSLIYDLMKRHEFPRPRKLTSGRVAWLEADVDAWISSRPIGTAW